MLGNPTTTEISDDDIEAFFEQAIIEYAYANSHTATITVEDGEAYDLSTVASDILDVTLVVSTTTWLPVDINAVAVETASVSFDASAQTLTVTGTSGEMQITYVKNYDYADIPTIDLRYVEYLCVSYCLEQIAAIRDRLPIVSSFKLVTGADILNESSRYLEKWNLRFNTSKVY